METCALAITTTSASTSVITPAASNGQGRTSRLTDPKALQEVERFTIQSDRDEAGGCCSHEGSGLWLCRRRGGRRLGRCRLGEADDADPALIIAMRPPSGVTQPRYCAAPVLRARRGKHPDAGPSRISPARTAV